MRSARYESPLLTTGPFPDNDRPWSWSARSLLLSRPALLFWGAFIFYACWSRGVIGDCDTEVRYHVALRMWCEGTIHPEPDYCDTHPGILLAKGKDGTVISSYGIGQSLTMLPAVAVADCVAGAVAPPEKQEKLRYLGGQFVYQTILVSLISASALLALYILAVRLGVSDTAATWAAVALGFGTYWFFYTKSMSMNVELTTWLLWALVAWSGRGAPVPRLAITSFLLGTSFLYRQELIIPIGIAFCLLLFQELRRAPADGLMSRALPLLVPAFLCGVAALGHNYVRTGNILSAGYLDVVAQHEHHVFTAPGAFILETLVGANKGYFWYNPLFFAVPLLLLFGLPHGRGVLWRGALPVAALIVFYSSVFNAGFVGGWGQRFLLPMTPFLILGVAAAFGPHFERAWPRRIVLALIAANVLFQGCMAIDDHNGVQQQGTELSQLALSTKTELAQDWRRNDIAGKLRNLGIPMGDPEWVTNAWRSSEMAALGPRLNDSYWWRKLLVYAPSRLASGVLTMVGFCGLALGAVLLLCALTGGRLWNFARSAPTQTRSSLAVGGGAMR